MSRSRPRDVNLRVVGHHEHKFVRASIILDVRDASPISSGRALLTPRTLIALRPLRALRTDKVHEQGPGPILLAKQVAAGRVQVDVAFFPQRSLRVRASMQKIHTAATAALSIPEQVDQPVNLPIRAVHSAARRSVPKRR